MAVPKQMLSLVCIVVHCLGNGMTLVGIYLLSVQPKLKLTWKTAPAYLLIVFGLMVVLIGFLWNICHSIKSKMYQRGAPEQQMQIYTIDR